MAVYETKNIKSFKEVGFCNPETKIMVSTIKKTEGEETDIIDVLTKMASDGEELEITIKKVSKIDQIEEIEDEE